METVTAPPNSTADKASSPLHEVQVNKVSASLSSAHIINSDRIHNTRKAGSRTRKRTNPRSARSLTKVDYTTFYNSEDTTTESSPSPKRTRTTAEISLREPTLSRINAQQMITRKRLQDMSPEGNRVRLIGTATSPQPLFKPKIKTEIIKRENIVKSEKQQEIDDYLAKGLCLSAHTDGSACANIQNPNNVNVAPMGIREHRRKQRAEKALFLAGLMAKQAGSQSTVTKARIAVTDTTPNTPAVQSTEVSTTSSTDSSNTLPTTTSVSEPTERCTRNVVTLADPPTQGKVSELPQIEQDVNNNRNGVTNTNEDLEITSIENTTDLDTTLTNSPEDDTTQHDVDLDNTMEYTSDIPQESVVTASPVHAKGTGSSASETDSMELIVNKNNTKTYTRIKRTKPIQEQLPLPKVIDSTDIDMIEDTRNAELIDLSENLAESLVITDLEELMNEQDQHELNLEANPPDRPMSPKGTFSYSFRGIRRKQSTPKTAGVGKYRCPTCPSNWDTRGAMCEHYRLSHPPLPCEECSMTFTSPLTLARHTYKHKERPYSCTVCDESFAFNSELTQHSSKHKDRGAFFCMANGCGREFVRQGDLNAHVVEHTGPVLRCTMDITCTYSSRNPRLFKAHENTHTRKKQYPCRLCGELFNFTQQRKRHMEKSH